MGRLPELAREGSVAAVRRGRERAVFPAVVALFVAGGMLAGVAGCAGSAGTSVVDRAEESAAPSGTVAGTESAGTAIVRPDSTVVLPPMTPAQRLAATMVDYDSMYVRIGSSEPIRKTYGVTFDLPNSAAGGKLAGLWMQVPDVDGGYAWALYDANGVEITMWIPPDGEEAKVGAAYGPGATAATWVEVDGKPALEVPRVWVPVRRHTGPGRGLSPAYWSDAEVHWVESGCRLSARGSVDVEELLDVVKQVEVTGEPHVPAVKRK